MSKSGEAKHAVGRREFLTLSAGGLGALALNGSPLSLTSAMAATASNKPNYYPAKIPPPDIPINPNGGSPAYLAFPKNLVKSVAAKPGRGGEVNGMVFWAGGPTPTPMENNIGWQLMNNELGTKLTLNIVPQSDYAAKWSTVTAGGDLPDLMFVSIVPVLPNVAAFAAAACTDLTPYLAGDAVKEYPNLANMPSASWNICMIDNKVWGIPNTRPVAGFPMFVETTVLQKLGLAGAYPKNADEFKQFCKALTDAAAGRWAFGVTNDDTTGPYSMMWFLSVFRGPNNWRLNPNGSLIKDIESEEYKVALAYLRELIVAGYMAPDVKSNAALSDDLFAGRIVMRGNSWLNYTANYATVGARTKQAFRIIPPFGHDGKQAAHMLSPGNFGWTVIKKSSPERVKELLRVLDYLAAPFGSEEFMVSKYGVQGKDWNYDDKGTPVLTTLGVADMAGSPSTAWSRLAPPPHFLFSSVDPGLAKFASEDEAKLLNAGVADPTQGYYSPTDAKSGAQLNRIIFDGVSDIASGRKPISSLDQLIKDWKSRGGDAVRGEYEKAIAG